MRLIPPLSLWTLLRPLLACLLVGACDVVNAPVSQDLLGRNVLLSSYSETPKHLDSVASYSNNETPWTYAIYEPPLKYHYLKRPYELVPRTLAAMPVVTYYDKAGRVLPANAPGARIARSVMELRVKPGIRYQPHPAFAADEAGRLLYHELTPAELEGKRAPGDFARSGTRELVAADYVYAIRRLATPRIESPAFGFLSEHITGLKAYGERIKQVNSKMKEGLSAREAGRFGHLPWLDFRQHGFPGAEVVDSHTLRISIDGKYPQFKFWLAMTFFAPLAWEVDAFYSQPGMKARNLTLDTWPVGTGPYMLTEYTPNHRMVLQRNPNYRGEPYPCEGEPQDRAEGLLADCGKTTPFIDGMVSVIEKEGSPMTAKFLQGYYDMPQFERGEPGTAMQVAIDDDTGRARELLAHKIKLPSTLQVGLWYYGFNWLDPVVGAGRTPDEAERNRKLRQAIAIAFDFEEFIQIFEDNRARPNVGPVVPGLFGSDAVKFNPQVYDLIEGKPRRKSIDEARRLLAEAGYPDGREAKTGKPLVINYDTQGVGPGYKARNDWTSKQFAKLNIALEIRNTDYNRFQDKMRKGAAQFFSWGWLADYPDPENFLFLLYGPNAKVKGDGENTANYKSAEFDALFEKMKDLDDTPERLAIIRRMSEIVQKDGVWLFGWSEEYTGAYQQWLANGKPSNIIRDSLPYLRLDPQRRLELVRQWNAPQPWPLAWFGVGLLALIVPAWMAWRRRQRATALAARTA
ncbi:MAG: ABC transporter substrate-binding protein [Burkholderiaceae bacterium]|nr:ABC transporter substrate-binding protein [Burkholderiaceae bacterium]